MVSAYDALGANYVPILHQNYHCLQTDQSEILYDACHLGVLLGCVQIDFLAYGMFHGNRAPILHQD
jgi:hypothetical protein